MVRKTVIGVVQLLGGLGAGLTIIALLVAWQFHKGPVSLAFLTPYVEQALNSGHRTFRLAIEDTTLTWAGWDRAVELRVKNVRAIGDNDAAMARIPELSMSLSGAALLRGQLAPKFIELLGPDLWVQRGADGRLGIEFVADENASGGQVASGLLRWLLREPEPGSPMSYLETVRVSGATLTIDDQLLGRSWQAPVGYLRLDRAVHGLIAEGSLLLDVEGRVADVSLTGSYQNNGKRLDVSATFSDIAPASFAGLDAKLARLGVIDLPLSGTVVVGMSLEGGLDTVGFNLTGGKGHLHLPAPMAQTLAIDGVALGGFYSGRTETLTMDRVKIDMSPDSTLTLPAPIAHVLPVATISGGGKYGFAEDTLTVTALDIEMGGPVFSLQGRIDGVGGTLPLAAAATASIAEVPVSDVERYWPSALGNDAWTWVTQYLAEGTLHRASVNFDIDTDPADGTPRIVSLDGDMALDGVEVTYIPGMPPATDVAGLVAFDADSFDIAIQRGKVGKIDVAGGTVHITGLREIDQFADINLRIEAPVADALRLIDHKPLGFAKAMGINPSKSSGSAQIDLAMYLLLAKDLTLNDVDVEAKAALKNVAIDNVVLGRGIRDGTLQLQVDKAGMDVDGTVQMGAIPVKLTWRENFADKPPFQARYEMTASIDDIHKVSDLGVHPPKVALDAVTGGVDASVVYTVFDKRSSRVEVTTNLARAEVDIPELNWHKTPGDPGRAEVTILIENGHVKRVPTFQVNAGDLSVRGDISYFAGGLGLERVTFERLRFGRSNLSGAVLARPDGGWEVGMHGDSLDITPLWHRIRHEAPGAEDLKLPDLTLALEVDKVWIDEDRFMTDASATLVHKSDIWRTVLLTSKIGGGSELNVRMTPDELGDRVLSVRADDAGETLRFMDLFDNMHGGKMEIRGRYDDAALGRPLKGEVRVVDYRVRNAPLLTRILSIMALTGIVDALTGDGLNFSFLTVPFTMQEGELQVRDAKATGASIGFTAGGTIYTHADVINLEGTVVPAYAINSFFGKIPLLGNLLTGGEDGGGVFAANFSVSGPIEEPETTVNPLSALTPGIFRKLFGVLSPDDNSGTLLAPPEDNGGLLAPSN